ncbi:hypothetical protein KJ782_04440 [Patescibacteria group bacterium]|nr:hypothetical protein [Patescibacteria group bacterium]
MIISDFSIFDNANKKVARLTNHCGYLRKTVDKEGYSTNDQNNDPEDANVLTLFASVGSLLPTPSLFTG